MTDEATTETTEAIVTPEPYRPYCAGGCDERVPNRGGYCGPCAEAQCAELRAASFARAARSLPDWPWCRVGSAEFRARCERRIATAIREWRREHGRGLVVLGPSGVGKTVGAVALAWRIVDYARSHSLTRDDHRFAAGVRFVSAADVSQSRRDSPLGVVPELMRESCAATLLVLDEVGYLDTMRDTAVSELIDVRYRAADRRTIVTSGLTVAGLSERYGDAIARRILDLGRVVDCHGTEPT